MLLLLVTGLSLAAAVPPPADALARYFNCINRVDKNGTLTLDMVNNCYDKVFTGGQGRFR